jgi:hypothetical protein
MGEDWMVIFTYTWAQAIDDGVLIDITDKAKTSGFKLTPSPDHGPDLGNLQGISPRHILKSGESVGRKSTIQKKGRAQPLSAVATC